MGANIPPRRGPWGGCGRIVSEHTIRVPRAALWGALGLIGFTIAAIVGGRHYDVGIMETPAVPAVAARDLLFHPRADGSMAVLSESGNLIANLVVEGDSFAMTAVRALAMQHPRGAKDGGVANPTYRLSLRRGTNGRLDLVDPLTGRKVPLVGFGADNLRAFAVYLEQPSPPAHGFPSTQNGPLIRMQMALHKPALIAANQPSG